MPGLTSQPLTPEAASHLGNCGHFWIGDTADHVLVDKTTDVDNTVCVIQVITDTVFTALVENMAVAGFSDITSAGLGSTIPAGEILRSGTGWTRIQLASGLVRCARKG